MKKYIFIKFLFVALTFAGLTSCKEQFLDTPPLGSLTAPNFFNTDAELMAGTAALYNKVWFWVEWTSTFIFWGRSCGQYD